MIHLEHCSDISCNQWHSYLDEMEFVPISQSWAWGQASLKDYGYQPLYFIIRKKSKIIGCFLLLKKGFLRDLIVVQKIIRGPLFIKTATLSDKEETFQAIRDYFPRGVLKLFSLQSNLTGKDVGIIDVNNGFKKTRLRCYESQTLDLKVSKEQLWQNLKSSWQKGLKSSQRHGFILRKLSQEEQKDFLSSYDSFRKNRSFYAPSGAFYREIHIADPSATSSYGIFLENENKPLASALISYSGDTATYLAGLINERGRKSSANHFLLWNLISTSKEMGFHYFDVGGIHMPHSRNIDRFKQRMGGNPYELAGTYV